MALLALAPGCTFIASYPGVSPEDTEEACSDGIDNDLDGNTDCADPDCTGFCPSAAVVAPTSLLPCYQADGVSFREDVDRAEPTCEPFPATPPTCEPGEALFPGRSTCTLLGAPCGDPFKPDVEADQYALQGQVGGDGSIDSPYALILRAMSELQDGGTVAVGAGDYGEHLTITRPMHLVGACPAVTRLIGGSATQPVIQVQSPDVIIEGFTLTSIGFGIAVAPGASLTLRDVIIEDVGGEALRITDGFLDAERVVIRNVSRADGAGLHAREGAEVLLSSILIEDIEGAGLVADGATVDIRASAIRRTGGEGVRVVGDAYVVGQGLSVAASAAVGVAVSCTESTADAPCLDLTDSILRHPTTDGAGLSVEGGGHIALTRTLVDGSHVRALQLASGHAALSHVVIRSTRRGPEESGTAIAALGGSTLEGRHLRLRANQFNGILLDRSSATLRDMELLGQHESGTSGVGLRARNGASVDIARFVIDSAGLCGLQLEADVGFTGVDGVISDNERGACLPPDAFTPEQMSTHITYAGNGRNFVVE
jgi:hypothetical protein